MSENSQFAVDKLFKVKPKLIGDSRIRQKFLNQVLENINPNPDLYKPCTPIFENRENSVIQYVLPNLTEFEYDEDTEEEASKEILGPFYVSENESLYIGQFNQEIREGRGIQVFKDGSYYEGYFKNNEPNQRGRLIFADGDMYLGELINNTMNGQGVYFKKDGSKYTGKFVKDSPEGKGREEWEDGAQFQGNYLAGSKDGYGVFRFANKTVYKGNFKDDLFWGNGELTLPNGTKYEGEWINGVLQSPAKIMSHNGNIYQGEILKMKQHGKGELFDHGRVFKGEFKNGKPEGVVKISNPDGTEQEALYEDGKFTKWLSKADKTERTNDPKMNKDNLVAFENSVSGKKLIKKKKKKKKGFLCCG